MIPLRASHVAFYTTMVTLTLTVALAFGFSFIRRQMLTGNDFLLDSESKEILPRLAQMPLPLDAHKVEAGLEEEIKEDEGLFYFQVREPEGKLIYHSPNLGSKVLVDLAGSLQPRTLDVPPFGLLRVAEYDAGTARLLIAMSLRNFQSVNHTFMTVFLLGIPLIALLTVAFGSALRYATLRPVRRMEATAARISASNLSERIQVPRGGGEMAALARLLNEMIGRLERAFKYAQRFSADVSHELMTPLSIIRLHAEKLLNDPELQPKYRQALEEQLQETLHLANTLERLLALAKADSAVLPLNLQPVAVHEFIGQFAEDAQLLVESRGLRFSLKENSLAIAQFDQGWIRQVLFNLLSNALRHSPPGGLIELDSCCAEGSWKVVTRDEGPGVPPARLADIFERFVQIAPRAGADFGAGLGLAICKSIIELHNGEISAANRRDRSGLEVTFLLPLDGNSLGSS